MPMRSAARRKACGEEDLVMVRLLTALSALSEESPQRLREQAVGTVTQGPDWPPIPLVDTAAFLRGITPQDRALPEESLRTIHAWVRHPDH
ncbi:hypothetical protein [Streptomyces sp. NPDC001948]